MPRKEIDYSKTVIYKLVCNDLTVTDLYVGHTTDFVVRKHCHKTKCNNVNSKSYNFKVYQMIRANGGWDNWTMVEVEKYQCNDGNEARLRERYYFELLNANMNTRLPQRTKLEYYNDNKEKMKEYSKEYRDLNKDKMREYSKEYRDLNKDKMREYSKEYGKEYGKARYQQNKEFLKECAKIRYQAKKDQVKEYNKLNKEKIKEYKKNYYQKKKSESIQLL